MHAPGCLLCTWLRARPLQVPCVAVVENMSFFEVDGVRHRPFGEGAGARICADFGLANFLQFPIVPDLSAAGDGGAPCFPAFPRVNRVVSPVCWQPGGHHMGAVCARSRGVGAIAWACLPPQHAGGG